MKQTFWQKYQVFIVGLAGAIAIALQQFIAEPEINWRAVGFAALMGVASYIAKEWRGKGVTITGFIGIAAYAYITVNQTGNFTWNQFILLVLFGVLTAVASPPKSVGYEKSNIIQQAKAEGEAKQPSTAPPNPPV